MKSMFLIIILIFSGAAHIFAEEALLPDKMTVMGRELALQLRQDNGPEGLIAEYIPDGKSFKDWDILFAVRFVPAGTIDARGSAVAMAKRILQRKKEGDSLANAMVFESNDKKVVVVDFLMSGDEGILEHNIWTYFNHKGGVASYQLARRCYTAKEAKPSVKKKAFIKECLKLRDKTLKELRRPDLPLP